jgi:HlyD family secretion protein
MSTRLSAAAFVATLVLAVCGPLYICPQGQLLPSTAHAESKMRTAQTQPAQKSPAAQAQSKRQDPIERARTAVETLIARLRGRDMPEGIVKSNGRIEATQVDVAAKYPGRLATLTVNEGDEVTAGQVVATISSPETEAQLRAAQAQVLKAKQALASAVALITQRKSDLDFTRTDYDRGKMLIEHGNIPQQIVDQRRNKFEAAEAAHVSANAQRDEAESAIKAAEADWSGSSRF